MKTLKKVSVLLLTLILCFSVPMSVFAQSVVVWDAENQQLDNGDYIVVEESTGIAPYSTGTKTHSKTVTYYSGDDDERRWSVTLTATFTYTGTSAAVKSTSTSYKIYDSAWKVTDASSSKSGSIATGEFIVKKYWLGIITNTVPIKILMGCDRNGNIT